MNCGFKSALRQKNKIHNTSRFPQSIADFIGPSETQQKIYAEITDDDIKISNSQGDKFTPPTEYTTDDLMLTIIVVGKGWIKEEVG